MQCKVHTPHLHITSYISLSPGYNIRNPFLDCNLKPDFILILVPGGRTEFLEKCHRFTNHTTFTSHMNPLHTVMSYDRCTVMSYDIIILPLLTQALSICQSQVHWSGTCHRWAAVSTSSGHLLLCPLAVGPSVLPLAERHPSYVVIGAPVDHEPEGGGGKGVSKVGMEKQVMRRVL